MALTSAWKQPIPTDIYELFGDDHLARDLFIHLLLRARNDDMPHPDRYAGATYQLKRGQTIFGSREYAAKLRCSVGAVHKALKRLGGERSRTSEGNSPPNAKVNTEPTNKFTVVTILNYDQIVGLERNGESSVNAKKTQREPNKSGKNEKSGKKPAHPPADEASSRGGPTPEITQPSGFSEWEAQLACARRKAETTPRLKGASQSLIELIARDDFGRSKDGRVNLEVKDYLDSRRLSAEADAVIEKSKGKHELPRT